MWLHESCHTCEWVTYAYAYEYVMSYMRMSHVMYTSESSSESSSVMRAENYKSLLQKSPIKRRYSAKKNVYTLVLKWVFKCLARANTNTWVLKCRACDICTHKRDTSHLWINTPHAGRVQGVKHSKGARFGFLSPRVVRQLFIRVMCLIYESARLNICTYVYVSYLEVGLNFLYGVWPCVLIRPCVHGLTQIDCLICWNCFTYREYKYIKYQIVISLLSRFMFLHFDSQE